MSHFEFICSGDLTPALEERTGNLVSVINSGLYVPFAIHKYWDDVVNETTKKRVIIIHTPINCEVNMREYLKAHFKDCGVEIHCFCKQFIF